VVVVVAAVAVVEAVQAQAAPRVLVAPVLFREPVSAVSVARAWVESVAAESAGSAAALPSVVAPRVAAHRRRPVRAALGLLLADPPQQVVPEVEAASSVFESFQHRFRVFRDFHFRKDVRDLSIRSNDECRAFDAHVLSTVHGFLLPHVVTLNRLPVRIRE
jgi:hypothetical protein